MIKITRKPFQINFKVANKFLNVHEWVEVTERNKNGPSLPLMSRESSESLKENQVKKGNEIMVSFDVFS